MWTQQHNWATRWNRRFWISAHNGWLPYWLVELTDKFFVRHYPFS